MFVTVSTLLLNTTGIELATRSEANIDRDLKVPGTGEYRDCGHGRICKLHVAQPLDPHPNRRCDRPVRRHHRRGGISRPFSLRIHHSLASCQNSSSRACCCSWAPGSSINGSCNRHVQLPLIDYLSLLAIALLIINWGFVAGVLIGVVIGCATFALSASRVSSIKFGFDGSEYRSSLDRSLQEQALLAAHGREIQGMALQSYLFFGSANRLYQHVKALLARQRGCRFLIFDFRRVTGLRFLAIQSFTQIKQAAADAGARIVLVKLSPGLERPFRIARFISDDVGIASDLDHALEYCEQATIEAHQTEAGDTRSLRAWFSEALGDTQLADRLTENCRRLDVKAGDIIARQGDTAASMHFILEGRVGIMVDLHDGHTTRVRSLGRHTTVGEMGLIARSPRSATIQAEATSVLYELDAEAFERIKRDQPALSQALLAYVIRVMTERLTFASRLIGVLQR